MRQDFALSPFADHTRRGRGHLAQSFDGALRTVLLHEAKQHREQNYDGDGDGFEFMPKEKRKRRCDEQNDNKDVLKLLEKKRPRRDTARGLKFIGTVVNQ